VYNREEKNRMISLVKSYAEDLGVEEMGSIVTEQVMDYIVEMVRPHIYNEALFDVNKVIKAYQNQLEDALYVLEKPTGR